VEPLPHTARALEALEELGDTGTSSTLRRIARDVLELVPDCVGLSLTLVDNGVTLTLQASDTKFLPLDAMQYLDGGPCVDAVEKDEQVMVNEADPLNEGRWSLFARASAAEGVQSSLSLPLRSEGRVVGGLNLYAARRDAFAGYVDEIADRVGAYAPQAVLDADLTFESRLRALSAPETLQDRAEVELATGIIARNQGLDLAAASDRLRLAAQLAGLDEPELARRLIWVDLL
jgi:GAF domain-containing protein